MRPVEFCFMLFLSAGALTSPALADEASKPFAVWNFEDDTSGCKPLRDIEISATEGVLHVVAIGNDPHFIGPAAGEEAGWVKMVIRCRSSIPLNSQLFWTTQAQPATSAQNSVKFKIQPRGNDWNETTVYFRTTSPLTQVRLDPHNGPVNFDIDSVTFLASGPPPTDPATDPAGFKTLPGFQVDLLYSVPAPTHGSWVSMTVDPKGRLIVSDQYGGLYRVTLNGPREPGVKSVVPLNIQLGSAQGLLYAFDSLYVMVNKGKDDSGLYRVTASKSDDNFDTVEKLQGLTGSLGEHGPHGIVLSPDGKSLYVVAGNNTVLPENISRYRLPKNWAEDQLLPRDPCSNGHNTNRMAPGGWVCKVSPDGKEWELMAAGFRNPYDIAFNGDGELFTYDADMEMDVGTPWYRPTRVCHVVSGGEFGWRWGTGKWPSWACDSLPAAADIGLGSPTGVCFGHGADFPAAYQQAFYVCDWTYGRLFAVHLTPKGASYEGRLEEFITGTPLPLTDILVNPVDQAMYFTIGGRRTQSGLYRVTYTGNSDEKDSPPSTDAQLAKDTAAHREVRRRLESFHAAASNSPVDEIWSHLSNDDRHIRYAARIAMEHQDRERWKTRALNETQPDAAINSLLALARTGGEKSKAAIVDSLIVVAKGRLSERQLIDCLRALSVTFARYGEPSEKQAKQLVAMLETKMSADSSILNRELCAMLIYLQSDSVVKAAVDLMAESVTQEDLLAYGMLLRVPEKGWTPALRRAYFSLMNKIESGAATGDYVGGGHFQIYTQRFRETAKEKLAKVDLKLLDDVLNARLQSAVPTGSPTPRKFVRNWTVEDLTPHVDRIGQGRWFENGRVMFTAATCIQCHRFNNTGGILGPDITGASKRYSRAVMLREVLTPSVQISDQFRTHVVLTSAGRVYQGKIINQTETTLTIAADPKRPSSVLQIPLEDVEEMVPSKVSMMPNDLLNTLTQEDILDLLAYIESGGNASHANFVKQEPAREPGFETIFDGKTLQGWSGDPKLWSVQDDAITGVTTDEEPLEYNKFLIWDGEVENFHLRAKVRLIGNSNSGIQYRSAHLTDEGEFVVGGYQCDIHPKAENNGMLYHERGRGIVAMHGQKVIVDGAGDKWITGTTGPVQQIKLDDWNTFEIIAKGNKLVHKLNGKVCAEIIDHHEDGRLMKGVVAIQVHRGPAMRVQVKDVEVNHLPAGGMLSLEDAPIPADAEKVPGRKPKKARPKK